MLYKSILNNITAALAPEFDKLVLTACQKQTHVGDLFLLLVNAHYNSDVRQPTVGKSNICPYMFGAGIEGFSEYTHNVFIGNYIENNLESEAHERAQEFPATQDDAGSRYAFDLEKQSIKIQYEMLIYLKIWESDMFLKYLYQLVRLAGGLEYDWHFSIGKKKSKFNTGNRLDIINTKILSHIKDLSEKLYETIQFSYKAQVRNAIAHSQYSFSGNYIHLNNYQGKGTSSLLKAITFDEWSIMIHNTLVLSAQIKRILLDLKELYMEMAKKSNNIFSVRINRRDPKDEIEFRNIYFDPTSDRWFWEDQFR